MSEQSGLFFPRRKLSPPTSSPHRPKQPSLNHPVIPLVIQNQVNGGPVVTPGHLQVNRHLKLQLQRVRPRRPGHHIHPLHPRLKLLDTLTNRPPNLDTQIQRTQGGIVEIQQPEIRYAGAVTRMGIQQAHQVRLMDSTTWVTSPMLCPAGAAACSSRSNRLPVLRTPSVPVSPNTD